MVRFVQLFLKRPVSPPPIGCIFYADGDELIESNMFFEKNTTPVHICIKKNNIGKKIKMWRSYHYDILYFCDFNALLVYVTNRV